MTEGTTLGPGDTEQCDKCDNCLSSQSGAKIRRGRRRCGLPTTRRRWARDGRTLIDPTSALDATGTAWSAYMYARESQMQAETFTSQGGNGPSRCRAG